MKNLYSILIGTVVVSGLFFLVDTLFYNNNSLTTNLFIIILVFGGYLVTYTSNTLKTRTAIFSGFFVGIVLIVYQIVFNSLAFDPLVMVGYIVLPGFFMMLGGFSAKITQKQMEEFVDHLFKRKIESESKDTGK